MGKVFTFVMPPLSSTTRPHLFISVVLLGGIWLVPITYHAVSLWWIVAGRSSS